jgi:hypothetical protein
MRAILSIVLVVGLLVSASAQSNDEKENVIKILRGVLEGLAEEAHINVHTIESCINDSKTVVKDIVDAVNLLKSNELGKVKQGIKLIGQALQVLPDAITECRSTE